MGNVMHDPDYKPCAGSEGPWCKIMSARLGEEHKMDRRTGIRVLELTNLTTGKRRVAGIYHRVHAKDDGLLLNYCPWCRARIAPDDLRPVGEL